MGFKDDPAFPFDWLQRLGFPYLALNSSADTKPTSKTARNRQRACGFRGETTSATRTEKAIKGKEKNSII